MAQDQEENLDDIRKLYPHMTDAELRIARANLNRYVAAIIRIYDRLKAEGKNWPTSEEAARMMEEDGFKATEVDI